MFSLHIDLSGQRCDTLQIGLFYGFIHMVIQKLKTQAFALPDRKSEFFQLPAADARLAKHFRSMSVQHPVLSIHSDTPGEFGRIDFTDLIQCIRLIQHRQNASSFHDTNLPADPLQCFQMRA